MVSSLMKSGTYLIRSAWLVTNSKFGKGSLLSLTLSLHALVRNGARGTRGSGCGAACVIMYVMSRRPSESRSQEYEVILVAVPRRPYVVSFFR